MLRGCDMRTSVKSELRENETTKAMYRCFPQLYPRGWLPTIKDNKIFSIYPTPLTVQGYIKVMRMCGQNPEGLRIDPLSIVSFDSESFFKAIQACLSACQYCFLLSSYRSQFWRCQYVDPTYIHTYVVLAQRRTIFKMVPSGTLLQPLAI